MLPQTPSTPRRVPLSRPVAIPLIVVLALGLGYLVTRPLGGEPEPSFFVIGSTVPGVQLGQVAPGTAQAATSPPLTLSDVDGSPVTLADFAGHPIWVIFWKTACEPCEEEAPAVAAAYAGHRAEGLAVIGIDVWDSAAQVHDYIGSHPVTYPLAVDSAHSFIDAYGVWGAPTHYFIGADGVIRDRYFGPMTPALIEGSLERIMATPTPS